jgi:hypothetical protein
MPSNEAPKLPYLAYNQPSSSPGLKAGDGGGTFDGMSDRISRLEGAQDGLKQSQVILLTALGIFGALFIGALAVIGTFQIFNLQKSDALSDQIGQIPEKIETRLQNITNTLSGAISASKQQAPQIILLPAGAPMGTTKPETQAPAK